MSARVKEQIREREKSGQNNAETGLPKRDDAAEEIDNADRELKGATCDPDLDPDEMAHRVGRCFPISDRHGEEDASPQRNDVGDAKGQIDEAEREQHMLRKDEEQGAEEKEHRRIESEEDAGNAQLHWSSV